MPRFYNDPAIEGESSSKAESDQDAPQTNVAAARVRYWVPLLFLTFFYYFISCGIERIYQPMVSGTLVEAAQDVSDAGVGIFKDSSPPEAFHTFGQTYGQ